MKNFLRGANSTAHPTRTGPAPTSQPNPSVGPDASTATAADIKTSESPDRYGGWDAEKANDGNNASFAGAGPRKGSRIDAALKRPSIVGGGTDSDSDHSISVGKQMELEAGNAIKYRTCSWPKTAALLFSEYICLAIMSFPYSYSVLGLVPGLILTIVVAAIVLYTSLIVWEFCLRHPEVRDVCDIGQMLFWNSKFAWWFTAVMFILNNTFIMGFHCLVGARYLNTVTKHDSYNTAGVCTIVFSMIMAIISWVCSLPRTFNTLSKLATLSAVFTFISVLLATIFAGVEDHPAGYPQGGEPNVLVVAVAGTPYVAGMSAFLNISYTFIGQITIPSFIAEMKEPKDFPKALWAVTIAEIFVFSICGAITYAYTGTQYTTAPAFGSLSNRTFELVSFSFMIPTLIFLGVLYASVSARFVFFNLFAGTKHMASHTVTGWAAWGGILAVLWIFAFIIAEVIPFFSDLLSLMSSLFDSFFGFIFWGTAYLRMRKADYGPGYMTSRGLRSIGGAALNIFLIIVGFYFLIAGTYTSVQSIIDSYESGSVGGPFTCGGNGLVGNYPPVAKRDVVVENLRLLVTRGMEAVKA